MTDNSVDSVHFKYGKFENILKLWILEMRFDGVLAGRLGRRLSQSRTTVQDAVDGRSVGYHGWMVATVNYKGIQPRMGRFKLIYTGSEDSVTYVEMNKTGFPRTHHKRIPVSE